MHVSIYLGDVDVLVAQYVAEDFVPDLAREAKEG